MMATILKNKVEEKTHIPSSWRRGVIHTDKMKAQVYRNFGKSIQNQHRDECRPRLERTCLKH